MFSGIGKGVKERVRSIITLTTDFGLGSPYVAQLKGVVLSICRAVELVDLTHGVKPQNIREGAIALADAAPRFPAGTIHLAVIDPGVGTSRRLIYAEIGTQRYVAPDNGLLSGLARRESPRMIVELVNKDYWLASPSCTFHGRDIMAPVAAHLANGLDAIKLGSQRESLVQLAWPVPRKTAGQIEGQVLTIDSFGNLITNISRDELARLGEPAAITVDCGGRQMRGIVPTYSAALVGEIVALFDSQGRLEIAQVGGNAAANLQIDSGEPVVAHVP